MSIKIEFNTDNDAFCDFAEETRRILLNICDKIDDGYTGGHICDCNGNIIGKWGVDC